MGFTDYADFLAKHSCKNATASKKSTHTRIPDKDLTIYGGSYHIPPDELEEFYRLYCDYVFVQNKKEYLTECQLQPNGQMLVDLDFRYNYDVEVRIHTKEMIDAIVMEYMETMKEVFIFDKETNISVFVFEKPNVNRLLDGSLTKDGIHIVFGLPVEYYIQQYIRSIIIKKAPDLLGELPLINDMDSVFDEGISKGTTNWQLYGSRKPSNEAYELKYHYQFTYDTSDSEWMIDELIGEFDVMKHFNIISAQFTGYHKYEKKPNAECEKFNHKKNVVKAKQARVSSAVAVTDSDSDYSVVKDDSKVRDILFNFIGSRFKSDGLIKRDKYEYFDKLKIASALKTLGFDSKMFCEWCELGAERTIKDPIKVWESCRHWESETLAFLCLEYILKRYDKNKFRIWRISNHSETVLSNLLSGEENTKAKFIAKEISRELVYCGEQWFMLNSQTNLWSVVKKPHALVSNYLTSLLNDEQESYQRKLNDASNDEQRKFYKEILGKIKDAILSVGMASRVASVLTFLSSYVCDNKFREKLDINLYRMPYKNGMLCLKTLTFRQGISPSDFVTKTISFDYALPIDDEIKWVKQEMKKIFNWNDQHLDYGMSFYGYTLTGDARREQNIWCMKGEKASNGKSVVLTALTDIIPEFVVCFPSELFELNYGERHKAIANWNGIKLGWLNELRKGKRQDEAFIKLVAEATPQEYKIMFGTMGKMPLTFKSVFVGNHPLKVDADEGIVRRYRHMQMNSDFQDENEDNFETRKFKKNKDFGKLLSTTYRNAFLHYIYTYSQSYFLEQKLKPYPIDWEIAGKNEMDANNDVLKWFNTHFQIDSSAKIDNYTFMQYIDTKIVSDEELKALRKKYNYDSQKAGAYYDFFDKDEKKMVKKLTKGMWFGFKVKEPEY